MNKKYNVFLEVCELLNHNNIIPLLFGSLGLSKVTNIDLKPQDIDFLVPKIYISDNWDSFKELIESIGFELTDLHEHEFLKNGIKIAFAEIESLTSFANINIMNIGEVDDHGKKYLLLNLKQYLKVYKRSAVDSYRKSKNYGKDYEKIELIERLLNT